MVRFQRRSLTVFLLGEEDIERGGGDESVVIHREIADFLCSYKHGSFENQPRHSYGNRVALVDIIIPLPSNW